MSPLRKTTITLTIIGILVVTIVSTRAESKPDGSFVISSEDLVLVSQEVSLVEPC